MSEIREEIRRYILTQFLPGENPSNLLDHTPLRASGILDSMGVLLLVRFIEEWLGTEIPAEELCMDNFGCIDRITSYVNRKTTSHPEVQDL